MSYISDLIMAATFEKQQREQMIPMQPEARGVGFKTVGNISSMLKKTNEERRKKENQKKLSDMLDKERENLESEYSVDESGGISVKYKPKSEKKQSTKERILNKVFTQGIDSLSKSEQKAWEMIKGSETQGIVDEEGNIIGYRPKGSVFQPKSEIKITASDIKEAQKTVPFWEKLLPGVQTEAGKDVQAMRKKLVTQRLGEKEFSPEGKEEKGKRKNFNSLEEAEKANLPKGTVIYIKGRKAIVE